MSKQKEWSTYVERSKGMLRNPELGFNKYNLESQISDTANSIVGYMVRHASLNGLHINKFFAMVTLEYLDRGMLADVFNKYPPIFATMCPEAGVPTLDSCLDYVDEPAAELGIAPRWAEIRQAMKRLSKERAPHSGYDKAHNAITVAYPIDEESRAVLFAIQCGRCTDIPDNETSGSIAGKKWWVWRRDARLLTEGVWSEEFAREELDTIGLSADEVARWILTGRSPMVYRDDDMEYEHE